MAMRHQWVESSHLKNGQGEDIWSVDITAFPLLNPHFSEKPSRQLRLIRSTYEEIRGDDRAYRRETARLLRPVGNSLSGRDGFERDIALMTDYLREADVYLCSAVELLPKQVRQHLRPARKVSECTDLRELLEIFFTSDSQRVRFEVQRKLLLAQLLLDIDHSRHIQDGPRHKTYFEDLLTETLWRHTRQVHEIEIGFHVGEDGDSIVYTSRPGEKDQRWTFHSIFLEKQHGQRTVSLDVLYYNCRFKRTVEPVSFEIVDGRRRVTERLRWGAMRQHSSGSILSKMIRKGINNPGEIADLVGAMFIVPDEEALDDLLTLLDDCTGSPFGWRNVTDTFSSESDRSALDAYSGRGYKVFKGDADILIPGASSAQADYRFQVEIQIYTLEGYLRTVCGRHEASHLALKLRQFLYGLVPKIFPRQIYGSDWLKLE